MRFEKRLWALILTCAFAGFSLAAGEPAGRSSPAASKEQKAAKAAGAAKTEDAARGHEASKSEDRDAETAPEGKRPAAGTPAEDLWAELMAGNARFVEGKTRERDLIRTRAGLVKGQHPRVVVLACSDSRLSHVLVFDQDLGEIFEVRAAGNIADPIGLGSIE